jgi:peptide/nickel transport system permease protein
VIFFVLVITAIFAPLLAPYEPNMMNMREALQKPSATHILGTDSLGRDTLSRIIYGSRISLSVGFVAIVIASAIGVTLGLIAGFFGGITYAIIMRMWTLCLSHHTDCPRHRHFAWLD